jgi:hypothetical protein
MSASNQTAPSATVPAATVSTATVPAKTVSAATVPAATVSAATVPAATVSAANTVEMKEYKVKVTIADKFGAGSSDTQVFITLVGNKSSSPETQLNSVNNVDNPQKKDKTLFDRNQTSTFIIKCASIGSIKSVSFKIAKQTIGGSLEINDIVVFGGDLTEEAKFTFNRKVSSDGNPVEIPVDPPIVKAANATGPEYTVTVKTADKAFAGTDDNITLVLFGNANEATIGLTTNISVIPDGQTKKNSNLFEKAQTDVFKFQTPDLGTSLQKIRIKSDGTDAWNIESITIQGGFLSGPIEFKYPGDISNKLEVELLPGDNAVITKDSASLPPRTANSQNKKSLASILRATAAQEYITQQLKTQFASLSGELAEKCNKCNTINPSAWKSNECETVCVPLEETASNNRGLFRKRSDLLKQLENVTTAQLIKILPDSKDRANFYNKYFYERLKQSGSFEDSMIDMNDKLEEFIDKVDKFHIEYASKESDLSSSTDERIKANTKIQINYDKSPVEYYFRPTQETYNDLNSLSSSVSSLSDEQLYCKRKKWLSCAVRAHKCDWIGDRNEKFKCQPIANAPAASGQAPAATGQTPAADPNQPPPPVSGGSRNISKQKKKIVRNLSKRRYF